MKVREVRGTLSVFGYPGSPATASVLPRSLGWRATRAGGSVLMGLVAAPVVALLPPHIAWALGAAVTGFILGARKWAERFTLLALEGSCPRCHAPLGLDRPTRLRTPFTVDCPNCHHGSSLTFPEWELTSQGADRAS